MTWEQGVDSQSESQRQDLFLDLLTPSVQQAGRGGGVSQAVKQTIHFLFKMKVINY
jgi:hypothetical protein